MRLRAQALAALETALTPWLQGANADALLYDKVYGGVVSTNGVADPYGDYGSGTTPPPCAAGHCVHQDEACPDASSSLLPCFVLHAQGGMRTTISITGTSRTRRPLWRAWTCRIGTPTRSVTVTVTVTHYLGLLL